MPCLAWLLLIAALVFPLHAGAQPTFSDTPASAAPQATLAPLSVEGRYIVDADGNRVRLRGLALSDPFHLAEEGQWTRRYFEEAAAWGANLVRIPVHPQWWREAGSEQYFAWLDQGVQWAGALGMYVIIDWHTIGNPLTGVPHRPLYLTTQEETFYFWHLVGFRYAGNPTVAFYELYNEPTNREGTMGPLGWPEYKAWIESLISMLYAIDDRKIPLVAGFDWAYELRSVVEDPIAFPGVAYVTHPYPQKVPPPWEQAWDRDFGHVADHYPVFATEFGFMSEDMRGAHIPVIADERYGKAVLDYFDRRGIHWTVWVFDPRWT
ncbi:MAG: cellulase family glycosylhydrolase, partial [Pseudomonadota bacterium]